jgi:hypothetical protein
MVFDFKDDLKMPVRALHSYYKTGRKLKSKHLPGTEGDGPNTEDEHFEGDQTDSEEGEETESEEGEKTESEEGEETESEMNT